jgi:negative regulator of sigma E activity
MFLLCCFPVLAEDTVLAEQVRYKEEVLQTLKNEIQQIDSEMARCEKAKKGWVAATVVGGVGVAATGAAAIAQGVKISQNKKAAAEPKEEKK